MRIMVHFINGNNALNCSVPAFSNHSNNTLSVHVIIAPACVSCFVAMFLWCELRDAIASSTMNNLKSAANKSKHVCKTQTCASVPATTICSAAEEQSLVAEEINNNTVNIKDLSTQVAESANRTNDAMQAQQEDVHKQDQILNRFTV